MKKFFTKYNHTDVVSPSGGVSMTDPQFLKDCDINTILDKYRAGLVPIVKPMKYGDFSEVGDFADALQRVTRAKEYFEGLPSDVRSRFGNDLTTFCDFALNPANVEECVKLGIFDAVQHEETALDVLKQINNKVTTPVAEPTPHGEGNA